MSVKKVLKKIIKIIALSIDAIFAILLIVILFFGYRGYRRDKIIESYEQIQNFKDAQKRYETDLKNKNLKYFYSGIVEGKPSFLKKYKLEAIWVGCMGSQKLELYNFLIEENVFKESHKYPIFFWMNFLKAIETSDIHYLIANSFDTLYCEGLNLKGDIKDDLFTSKFIFTNHLDKITQVDNLSTRREKFSRPDPNPFIWPDSLRINYIIESDKSDSGKFNLTYLFKKIGNQYFFSGMKKTYY